MMLDKQNLLSDGQSLALALAATALSTNTIDLGVAGTVPLTNAGAAKDVGKGEPPQLLAQVVEDVVGAGASIEAQLVMADTADLATGLVVVQSTGAIGVANLRAGYQFRFSAVPPGITKRYLGMRYVNSGAATTAGKVTAGIVADKQTTSV